MNSDADYKLGRTIEAVKDDDKVVFNMTNEMFKVEALSDKVGRGNLATTQEINLAALAQENMSKEENSLQNELVTLER